MVRETTTETASRIAVLCPQCAHRSILDDAVIDVARCTLCNARLGSNDPFACICGHAFKQHDTRRDVASACTPRTFAGYLVRRNVTETEALRTVRALASLGGCNACTCADYRAYNGHRDRGPGTVSKIKDQPR